jgi:glycosyltransferase involved in cell wall biosynthesis
MHNIHVGILIPTFNRINFLKVALKSALGQTFREIRVVVIDNGSTDGTGEFMRSVSDSRLAYVVNDRNLGLMGSINKGIEMFPESVAWCTILCDDDELEAGFIQGMIESIRIYSPASIVHGKKIIIDQEGKLIRHASDPPEEENAIEYLRRRLLKYRETFLTGLFFRRDMFRRIGGYPVFRTGAATDDAFIFALALQDRLVYQRNAVVRIRFHEAAESHAFRDIEAILQTFRQFQKYCEEMAFRYAGLREKERNDFKEMVLKYVQAIQSEYWIQCFRNALEKGEGLAGREALALTHIIREFPKVFSLRVRLDAFSVDKFRCFPEINIAYKLLWVLFDPPVRPRRRLLFDKIEAILQTRKERKNIEGRH